MNFNIGLTECLTSGQNITEIFTEKLKQHENSDLKGFLSASLKEAQIVILKKKPSIEDQSTITNLITTICGLIKSKDVTGIETVLEEIVQGFINKSHAELAIIVGKCLLHLLAKNKDGSLRTKKTFPMKYNILAKNVENKKELDLALKCRLMAMKYAILTKESPDKLSDRCTIAITWYLQHNGKIACCKSFIKSFWSFILQTSTYTNVDEFNDLLLLVLTLLKDWSYSLSQYSLLTLEEKLAMIKEIQLMLSQSSFLTPINIFGLKILETTFKNLNKMDGNEMKETVKAWFIFIKKSFELLPKDSDFVDLYFIIASFELVLQMKSIDATQLIQKKSTDQIKFFFNLSNYIKFFITIDSMITTVALKNANIRLYLKLSLHSGILRTARTLVTNLSGLNIPKEFVEICTKFANYIKDPALNTGELTTIQTSSVIHFGTELSNLGIVFNRLKLKDDAIKLIYACRDCFYLFQKNYNDKLDLSYKEMFKKNCDVLVNNLMILNLIDDSFALLAQIYIWNEKHLRSVLESWAKIKKDLVAPVSPHMHRIFAEEVKLINPNIAEEQFISLLFEELKEYKRERFDSLPALSVVTNKILLLSEEGTLYYALALTEKAFIDWCNADNFNDILEAMKSIDEAIITLKEWLEADNIILNDDAKLSVKISLSFAYYWKFEIQRAGYRHMAKKELDEKSKLESEKPSVFSEEEQDVTHGFSPNININVENKYLTYLIGALNIWKEILPQLTVENLKSYPNLTDVMRSIAEVLTTADKGFYEFEAWSIIKKVSEINRDNKLMTTAQTSLLLLAVKYYMFEWAKELAKYQVPDELKDLPAGLRFILAQSNLNFCLGKYTEGKAQLERILSDPLLERMGRNSSIIKAEALLLASKYCLLPNKDCTSNSIECACESYKLSLTLLKSISGLRIYKIDNQLLWYKPVYLRILFESTSVVGKLYYYIGAPREVIGYVRETLILAQGGIFVNWAIKLMLIKFNMALVSENFESCQDELFNIDNMLTAVARDLPTTPTTEIEGNNDDEATFISRPADEITLFHETKNALLGNNGYSSPRVIKPHCFPFPSLFKHKEVCKCTLCFCPNIYKLHLEFHIAFAKFLIAHSDYSTTALKILKKIEPLINNHQRRMVIALKQIAGILVKPDLKIDVELYFDLYTNLANISSNQRDYKGFISNLEAAHKYLSLHCKGISNVIHSHLYAQILCCRAMKSLQSWVIFEGNEFSQLLNPSWSQIKVYKNETSNNDSQTNITPKNENAVKRKGKGAKGVSTVPSKDILKAPAKPKTPYFGRVNLAEQTSQGKKLAFNSSLNLSPNNPPTKSCLKPKSRVLRSTRNHPELETFRKDSPLSNSRNGSEILDLLHDVPITPKIDGFNAKNVFNKESVIKDLRTALELIEHFPNYQVYSTTNKLLALMSKEEDSSTQTLKSFNYLCDSMAITLRHQSLVCQSKKIRKYQEKKDNPSSSLKAFESDCEMRKILSFPSRQHSYEHISEDYTIIQLSTPPMELQKNKNECPDLIISRYKKNKEPLLIYLNTSPFMLNALTKMVKCLQDSKATATQKDPKTWWNVRIEIDTNMKNLLHSMENVWLGFLKIIFLGEQKPVSLKEVLSLCKIKNLTCNNTQLLELLINGIHLLNDGQKNLCISYLFSLSTDSLEIKGFVTLITILNKKHSVDVTPNPIVLILDKVLQQLPWENLPMLRPNSVTRMPSLSLLNSHMFQLNHTPKVVFTKGVEPSKTFYILNPSKDISYTQDKFKEIFAKQEGWEGLCGQAPTSKEIAEALTNKDLMIYCGHGAGQAYLGGDWIEKLHCRAAAILMGCSSGKLRSFGKILEPQGVVYQYLLGGSPMVVANLWDITDKDIDRFTHGFFKEWLPSYESQTSKFGQCVTKAIAPAREECRLKYLIGAAPVIYGIPLKTQSAH